MKRTILSVAIILAATHARAAEVTESDCYVMAAGIDGQIHTILEGTKVLDPTHIQATFSIAIPDGYRGASIGCDRNDLVPAENDWKVLSAGFPMYIKDTVTGQLGALELSGGQFRFRAVSGEKMTPDQMGRMQVRLNQLQTTMDAADAAKPVTK